MTATPDGPGTLELDCAQGTLALSWDEHGWTDVDWRPAGGGADDIHLGTGTLPYLLDHVAEVCREAEDMPLLRPVAGAPRAWMAEFAGTGRGAWARAADGTVDIVVIEPFDAAAEQNPSVVARWTLTADERAAWLEQVTAA